MTFREKLAQERPDIASPFVYCPYEFELEAKESGLCKKTGGRGDCIECWDREMPEDEARKQRRVCINCKYEHSDGYHCSLCDDYSEWEKAEETAAKPMTQEEQERHDTEINEEIISAYCKQYEGEPCNECPADMVCGLGKGTWHAKSKNLKCPTSAEKQRAMLDAFEAALPPEDDAEPTALGKPLAKSNVERHKGITEELNALYARKNADYGDSFHRSYLDWGLPMAAIRLGDKYNRFVTLVKTKGEAQVKDESLRDTLIDLANYAIMTVMELDNESEE